MKIYIAHTEAGEIRSVVRAEGDPGIPNPVVAASADETVTEIPAEGITVELSPLEIHENYRVDVERGVLVPKQPAEDDG